MNINLHIAVILVSLPSLYLVQLPRYGLFIVFMTIVYTQGQLNHNEPKMPNPEYATTKYTSQALLQFLLIVTLSGQLSMD